MNRSPGVQSLSRKRELGQLSQCQVRVRAKGNVVGKAGKQMQGLTASHSTGVLAGPPGMPQDERY